MGGEKDPVLPDPLPKPDARFLKIVSEYDLRFEVFDLGPEDVTRPAMAAGKCHLDARDAGCRLPRASFPRGDTVFTRPCPLHSLVVEVYLDGIVAECPQTARVEIRDPEERGVAGGELLVFTDAAATKVGELIRGEGNPALMLRVFVQGGGCSGFQYSMSFENQSGMMDKVLEIAVVVTYLLIVGAVGHVLLGLG